VLDPGGVDGTTTAGAELTGAGVVGTAALFCGTTRAAAEEGAAVERGADVDDEAVALLAAGSVAVGAFVAPPIPMPMSRLATATTGVRRQNGCFGGVLSGCGMSAVWAIGCLPVVPAWTVAP